MSEEIPLLSPSQQAISGLSPYFAPLPLPFIRHLFEAYIQEQRRLLNANYQKSLPSPSFDGFYQKTRVVRNDIYVFMKPYIGRGEKLSSRWLVQELLPNQILSYEGKETALISPQTLSDYRSKYALRYIERDMLEPYSAAALAIAFALYKKERHRVPTMVEAEPHYWVWIRQTHEESWHPCPFPLPKDLPSITPIISHWAGTAWQSPWLLIAGRTGGIGAARFAGTTPQGKWRVSLEELALWDPEYIDYIRKKFEDADEDTELLQDVANTVLRKLAKPFLSLIHLPPIS
jgi:hypothetical protein